MRGGIFSKVVPKLFQKSSCQALATPSTPWLVSWRRLPPANGASGLSRRVLPPSTGASGLTVDDQEDEDEEDEDEDGKGDDGEDEEEEAEEREEDE